MFKNICKISEKNRKFKFYFKSVLIDAVPLSKILTISPVFLDKCQLKESRCKCLYMSISISKVVNC